MTQSHDGDPGDAKWPHFFAWCSNEHRLEALLETMLALPGSPTAALTGAAVSLASAFDELRSGYATWGRGSMSFDFRGSSGRVLELTAAAYEDRVIGAHVGGPIELSTYMKGTLFPPQIGLRKKRHTRVVPVEAATACLIAMTDMEELLLRMCTAHSSVTTGGCRSWCTWEPPLEMGATYHADGYVARDLALSWILLHDKPRSDFNLDLDLGLPIDVLRQRVEAAPVGAAISIPRRGEITREQVLAALDMPSASLFDALEACAVPDAEWQSVEPAARHYVIEGDAHPSATTEVGVTSRDHVRFIENHAPYHVRRLPNGGVILATHPYRTLWPLWSSALDLLGIGPLTT